MSVEISCLFGVLRAGTSSKAFFKKDLCYLFERIIQTGREKGSEGEKGIRDSKQERERSHELHLRLSQGCKGPTV